MTLRVSDLFTVFIIVVLAAAVYIASGWTLRASIIILVLGSIGVVLATMLGQEFDRKGPTTVEGVRTATLEAGRRRARACLMTTATTILALLPVLTSTGRGSDVMVPMAIPSFGGMLVALLSLVVVPVLYCSVQEWRLRLSGNPEEPSGRPD